MSTTTDELKSSTYGLLEYADLLTCNHQLMEELITLRQLNRALSEELDMSQKLVEGYQRKIANDGSVL